MSGYPDFSHRSCEKELLDGSGIPFCDIERNMRELDVINTWLGGHAISIAGFEQVVPPTGDPGQGDRYRH
jgi:hypothetical protein